MLEIFFDVLQIVLADIVLSGDNALIIGMAAASFSEKERKKIIFYGLFAAAALRILFALVASFLITIPGLLLIGSILLYWVCYKFFLDIRSFVNKDHLKNKKHNKKLESKNYKNALITIIIADISMSLDNVIAVTAIARDQTLLLIFGIGFSILLIALFATAIVKLLKKYHWVSYLGLGFLIYISTEMAIDGYIQIKPFF